MPVHIGSKYTGKPAAHADTTTGVYWEALPKISGQMLTIQDALLTRPKEARRPIRERFKTTIDTALTSFTERRRKPRTSLPGVVGMPK